MSWYLLFLSFIIISAAKEIEGQTYTIGLWGTVDSIANPFSVAIRNFYLFLFIFFCCRFWRHSGYISFFICLLYSFFFIYFYFILFSSGLCSAAASLLSGYPYFHHLFQSCQSRHPAGGSQGSPFLSCILFLFFSLFLSLKFFAFFFFPLSLPFLFP